jgi:hypothetical protein
MLLIGILFVIAIWDVSKSAVRNARGSAPSSSSAPARSAPGRPGGSASRGVRQRQAGYWAREAAGGFPAARTGWHAGWLAHKTVLAQQRNIREAARTGHIEAERDTAASIREHRTRQAEAQREIEDELAAQQAKGSPATGRKAVRKAADEVARKRQEREQATGGRCPGCGAPDGYDHLAGCDPSVPPLPADGVRRTEPAVIDTPVRAHNAEDSAHLNPGDKRCEGCGGSGRNADSSDACPVCRGWGSAPPDPMSPLAAPDAVCATCGNTGKPGNPVLAARGGNIHLSHAQEQQEAYWDRLNRLHKAREDRHAEIDDAVIGADHGFEGEYDTGAGGAPDDYKYVACPDCGADIGERCKPDCHYDPSQDRDASRNPQPITTTASPTEGAPMTADTNYTTVLQNAKLASEQADQDTVTASARRVVAQQHAEEMQAVEVDPATLSSQMELVERLQAAEQAAKETGEHAMAVYTGLQQRHGGLKEAHDDAPVRAAQREFYEGS